MQLIGPHSPTRATLRAANLHLNSGSDGSFRFGFRGGVVEKSLFDKRPFYRRLHHAIKIAERIPAPQAVFRHVRDSAAKSVATGRPLAQMPVSRGQLCR